MAPTEYRVIAKRAEPRAVPRPARARRRRRGARPRRAGAWHDATGLWIRDGYGQTETGQLTGMPLGERARPGSMGRPLPGIALEVVDGELVLDPATDPTFFLRYLGEEPPAGAVAHRRPRARRRGRLPVLRGPRRRRDRLGRLPDRAVRGRVGRSAAHPAVAEAAVVAAPDESAAASSARSWCCATASLPPTRSRASSRTTSRRETAPYKYPRVVDFAAELPRTPSGKLRRAALR